MRGPVVDPEWFGRGGINIASIGFDIVRREKYPPVESLLNTTWRK